MKKLFSILAIAAMVCVGSFSAQANTYSANNVHEVITSVTTNIIQDEDAEPHCDNGPWRNLLKNENAKQLALCINGLSETQAASVKLAYLKGFSREEIAAQLKTKVNTVKSWLHRAQENLRKCLMQY